MRALVRAAVIAVVEEEEEEEEVVEDLAVIDRLAVMVDVEMTATEGIAFSQSIIRMYQLQSSVCVKFTCAQLDATICLMLF